MMRSLKGQSGAIVLQDGLVGALDSRTALAARDSKLFAV